MKLLLPYLFHLEQLDLIADLEFFVSFTPEMAMKLLNANPHLKRLDIGLAQTFDKILNVISGNPSISKLTIHGKFNEDVNEAELNHFASKFPLIEELSIYEYGYIANNANLLIRQLNSLKQFTFWPKDQTECDRILNQLDKWQHEISDWQTITIKLSQ